MRTWPPEWTPDLFTGDMWAAATVQVDTPAVWADPGAMWADAGVTWAGAGPAIAASPVGGQIVRDYAGITARTTATIDVPADTARLAGLGRGQWVTIRGHICPPASAPADGTPDTVPACTITRLLITAIAHDRAAGTVTLTCNDVVTLLGARQLDTGTGATGYLPTARDCKAVITELVARFADPGVTVTDRGAPNAAWSPPADGKPLTGPVWTLIEDVATLAGISLQSDSTTVIMSGRLDAQDQTGITITETAGQPGTVAASVTTMADPAPTNVIVTGQDAAGTPIAGRAIDASAAQLQRFTWDDTSSVSGATTAPLLSAAAAARLAWLRDQQIAGQVDTPWLPMLEPGDLVQVMWADVGPRTHYVQAVTIPLDPAQAQAITLRGGQWTVWQTWKTTHTWETLRQASWMTRLRTG